MKNFVVINDQIIEETQALISIKDRAFLFGDGIFETCKISDGKIRNFQAHQNRIKLGLKTLKFFADISDLEKKSQQLIAQNHIKNGLLKINISRGSGSLGYLPTNDSQALILIQTFAPRKLPEKISLGISSYQTTPQSFGKTLNALPYVLSKIEAQEKNLFDGVLLSAKKFVAETSSANIFWVKNGKIFTPKISCGIVAGTVRQQLLKIAPIKIFEVAAKISALKNADEIFLTNAAFSVISVDEFMGRKLQKNFAPQFLKLIDS